MRLVVLVVLSFTSVGRGEDATREHAEAFWKNNVRKTTAKLGAWRTSTCMGSSREGCRGAAGNRRPHLILVPCPGGGACRFAADQPRLTREPPTIASPVSAKRTQALCVPS